MLPSDSFRARSATRLIRIKINEELKLSFMLSSKRNHKSKCEKYLFDLFVTKPGAIISNACVCVCEFIHAVTSNLITLGGKKNHFRMVSDITPKAIKNPLYFMGECDGVCSSTSLSGDALFAIHTFDLRKIVDTRNAISPRSHYSMCVCARMSSRRVSSSFFNFILILGFAYWDSSAGPQILLTYVMSRIAYFHIPISFEEKKTYPPYIVQYTYTMYSMCFGV